MKYVFAIAILSASALTAFGQCSDADKKALIAFDQSWAAAGLGGDKTTLTGIYADDYVGFPGMESKTAAIDATMKTFENNRANPANVDKVTYDHYYISCTPVSATVTHRNTITSPKGATFYTRSVHFLEKRNGKWVAVSNAGNALGDSAVVWYLEQDWNDAVLKKDKAWFEKNYAEDFTSISSLTGKLLNKAEAIADDTDPSVTMELVETTNMNVRVDGNTAVVTGIFRTKGRGDKGPFDRRIRYTDTWVKRDGRWVAWASQGTVINEPTVAKN